MCSQLSHQVVLEVCLYLHGVTALLFAYSQGEGGGHLLTKDKEATLISYLPSKIRTGYLAPSIRD